MIIKLALLSLRFEKLLTVSLTATMMAVIAPLLILFSLRYGIVSTLENNLKSSPVNLEIKLNTGYKLDESFFNLVIDKLYNQDCIIVLSGNVKNDYLNSLSLKVLSRLNANGLSICEFNGNDLRVKR